jgi:hypothetical protein
MAIARVFARPKSGADARHRIVCFTEAAGQACEQVDVLLTGAASSPTTGREVLLVSIPNPLPDAILIPAGISG